jgi:hypothetical protein
MGAKIGSKFSAVRGFLHFQDSCCAQNMTKYAPHCKKIKKKKSGN